MTLSLTAEIFLEGLKAGLLTFGGAFTVIPVLQQGAVVDHGWLSESQFVDGLALGGILPAPLIIFSTFVGYLAGGMAGAPAMTVGIFLPAFVLPIFFHRQLVAIAANDRDHAFLLGVAAGVIGPIAAVTSTSSTPAWSTSGPACWRSPPSSPCCAGTAADRALRGARLRARGRAAAGNGRLRVSRRSAKPRGANEPWGLLVRG